MCTLKEGHDEPAKESEKELVKQVGGEPRGRKNSTVTVIEVLNKSFFID